MFTNTDTNVRYISSEYIGTPQLLNEFGSLNNLLEIVLSEGFNTQTVESISTQSGKITLRLPLNHGFVSGQVLQVSGAVEEFFNGMFRVQSSDALFVTFLTENLVAPEQATTNTSLEVKVAPLGYDMVFKDVPKGILCFKNKSEKSPAILKSIDIIPPNEYLNTWAKFSRIVVGQEIDEHGLFVDNKKIPYSIEYPNIELTGDGKKGISGIHGYAKWDYAIYNSNYDFTEIKPPLGIFPTRWHVIGDDKTFYIMIQAMGRSNFSFNLYGFGNYISDNPEETTNICLQARHGYTQPNVQPVYGFLRSGSTLGALMSDYSGYLFSNIYGNNNLVKSNYSSCGMFFGDPNRNFPWLQTSVKALNPGSGSWTLGEIGIKDSDLYLRGVHRGILIPYGLGSLKESFTEDYIIIEVAAPFLASSSSSDTVSMVFPLKNWDDV